MKTNLQTHKRCGLLNLEAGDKVEDGIMLSRRARKRILEQKPKMIDGDGLLAIK